MGKQINYWMDYDNFLLVAQMAVDLGCTVVKEDLKIGKVIESKDAGIIPPYGTSNYPGYYFHLPEAGAIEVLTVNGKECLDYGYTATGNSGYHDENKKDIPATLPSSMSPQALPGHGRKRKSTGQESIAYLDITMKMKSIYQGRTV